MIAIAGDWIYRLHGALFKHLSRESFDAIHYGGMAAYKMTIVLLTGVPLLVSVADEVTSSPVRIQCPVDATDPPGQTGWHSFCASQYLQEQTSNSMDEQPRAQERAFYRLQYPLAERPHLQVDDRSYKVSEISEEGARILLADSAGLDDGQSFEGVIQFHDGENPSDRRSRPENRRE